MTFLPSNLPMHKVATVTYCMRPGLEVYWNPDTRRFYCHLTNPVYDPAETWFDFVDANIFDTLSLFLHADPDEFVVRNLFLFDRPGHGRAADDALLANIYDCEWSDFACDKLSLEFDVVTQAHPPFGSKWERIGWTLAEHHRPYQTAVRPEDVATWGKRAQIECGFSSRF